MKRIIAYTVVICIIGCALAACSNTNRFLELAICGSYGVPGMMTTDLKGGSFACEVIDTDPYGRVMFSYCAISSFSRKEETVLVICQAIDEDYVYFYEDHCYIPDLSDSDKIQLLKDINDWGNPLDYEKMSKRQNKISNDLFLVPELNLIHSSVVTACSKNFDHAQTISEIFFLDTDQNGHVLYQVNVLSGDAKEIYLAIVDSEYHTELLKWSPDVMNETSLSTFKRENGWVFG